jgi:hypothetical protein
MISTSQRRTNKLSVIAAITIGAVAALTLGLSPAGAATSRIYLGGVGPSAAELTNQLGAPADNHAYGQLTGGVPTGLMISMRDKRDRWDAVASAAPGSSIYTNLARWADTLKTRSGPIYFNYHHEPEASGSTGFGTSADFVRAYRHVVDIFRAQGAVNVKYVWQMTSYSFEVASSDRRAAAKWYPGDSYVDVVSSDAYNFYNTGPGRNTWLELAPVATPTLTFARAHGKTVILGEFGCAADSRRAAWLANAQKFFAANRGTLIGVFYFNITEGNFHWQLTSSADKRAYANMAKDTSNFVII